MYEQMAIDRIGEVENLTDNLADEEASWLIRWGIDKAPLLLANIEDEEEAGAKINALMAVMRKVNEIVPARGAKTPDDLTDDLKALAKLYKQAFGDKQTLDAKELANCAARIKKRSPLEAIQAMLTLFSNQPTPDKSVKSKK